jgi:peptidoglycan/xylan/chitin deacetylase (PgdA/CDA1 family)
MTISEFKSNPNRTDGRMLVSRNVNVPILTYHSIDTSGSVISTKPEVFRSQMEHLSENGYQVVTLNHLIRELTKSDSDLTKTVAITFDDGFQNFYTSAFPVLEEYGFKATVFLVTDFCGKTNDWAGNPKDFPLSKVLSWTEIRELNKHGIEFGGHTLTHPDLTKIPEFQLEKEIKDSKAQIEDSIGCEVTTFAYPFGKFNAKVKETVEKSYEAACSVTLGKVHQGSDFFGLERVDAYYLADLRIFSHISSKSFDGYLRIRQFIRNIKALSTNKN